MLDVLFILKTYLTILLNQQGTGLTVLQFPVLVFGVILYLQSIVNLHVELLQLVLRDGGVVGAEELLNLDACQAAVPAPLSQPGHGLRAQQKTGSG